MDTNDETQDPLAEEQESAAAADAGSIGGEVGADNPDPAMQPAENEIANEHVDGERSTAEYGEPDEL